MSYEEFVAKQAELVGKTVEFTAVWADGRTRRHQRKVWDPNEFGGTGKNDNFTITNVRILR